MAQNATHFFSADRGGTSVFKFRVGEDPSIYVWFVYADGSGSLHTTPHARPFRVEDPLGPAEFPGLAALLAARGIRPADWREDLLAQYGERIAWRAPSPA